MRPILQIPLDGDPLDNNYSNVLPIDIDGDGRHEFLVYNGTSKIRVYSASGSKIWQVDNPGGRVHDVIAGTHRDSWAVLDLDGDGLDDIALCGSVGMTRELVYRSGRDGHVLRTAPITTGDECHVAAFRVAGKSEPIVLVANRHTGDMKGCPARNFVGYWTLTTAFDTKGEKLWERNTCDAGHAAYPLDEDDDGAAEGIFVGKYLLGPDGDVRCTLEGWAMDDHADSVAVADLDPSAPGKEAVATGMTGIAVFTASTCTRLWTGPAALRNPQQMTVARLDPASNEPIIVARQRGSVERAMTFMLDGRGRVLGSIENGIMPMQNANFDGHLGVDELVGSFGRVTDRAGRVRLDTDWYWNLKGSLPETNKGPYPDTYDRWAPFPLVFDLDDDGRDELITWGQSLIVVGAVAP